MKENTKKTCHQGGITVENYAISNTAQCIDI